MTGFDGFVFEDEGLQLLENWEKESPLLTLDGKSKKTTSDKTLDLNNPPKELAKEENNDYTKLFE